nr:hypothetical protein [Tanacetum cinerariifolium]
VKKAIDVVRLQTLIDRKKVIITENTVCQALRLDDAKNIDCLPSEEIFTELARIGVGKGFSRVETPLFECMLVPQQAADAVDVVVADSVPTDDAADDVPAADVKPTPQSPPPTTTPPPPPQELPFTSQVAPTLPLSPHQSLQQQPSSPLQQPQPSQTTTISMDLLKNLLENCTALTKRVENLEQNKVAQALEITKLKQRVKRLEKKNKVKVFGLKRLKEVGTAQSIKSSADIVMDDQDD